MPRMYKSKHKGDVFATADGEDQMVYRAGGRNFVVQVREVPDDEVEQMKLVAIGH